MTFDLVLSFSSHKSLYEPGPAQGFPASRWFCGQALGFWKASKDKLLKLPFEDVS